MAGVGDQYGDALGSTVPEGEVPSYEVESDGAGMIDGLFQAAADVDEALESFKDAEAAKQKEWLAGKLPRVKEALNAREDLRSLNGALESNEGHFDDLYFALAPAYLKDGESFDLDGLYQAMDQVLFIGSYSFNFMPLNGRAKDGYDDGIAEYVGVASEELFDEERYEEVIKIWEVELAKLKASHADIDVSFRTDEEYKAAGKLLERATIATNEYIKESLLGSGEDNDEIASVE